MAPQCLQAMQHSWQRTCQLEAPSKKDEPGISIGLVVRAHAHISHSHGFTMEPWWAWYASLRLA
jgi:hypothetical protein